MENLKTYQNQRRKNRDINFFVSRVRLSWAYITHNATQPPTALPASSRDKEQATEVCESHFFLTATPLFCFDDTDSIESHNS